MSESVRVLLVDDEPLVLEIFHAFFARSGFEVVVANNSRDALTLLKTESFDVMVSDVVLDEFDGFDLLMFARQNNFAIVPILITGAPSTEDAERANELGAAYLPKPVGFDLVLSTVERGLERR